uniref:Uncharacterized protein n=1 Tax=Chlamydomonas chlamydogama TaxID=225041 RepID=A0A7S2VUQ2_9CHLO|mmetsp:Transcript_1087/g.2361  ORF Transcript_1087/g.2361 Transcript_1087/m.2361 type:complete len:155 (+) Transcript_1087:175-639(+)|eukprot:CAMPEP_0202920574 /NCGR_PEP_ID=MMETSP1392-20130828/76929_1 /ASSEMBLY_ACC=CAM_ASM_000868 /TAXON_ID=225041 /ORGANISM="Chlamydomonas chlamydogama, Strain SAG 11-48b" /LENGTH=154 /DNA_ID=CAMNT_0049614077 /DNA_START=164 /DNA_END=628 /DNA_ORIENTATION=-
MARLAARASACQVYGIRQSSPASSRSTVASSRGPLRTSHGRIKAGVFGKDKEKDERQEKNNTGTARSTSEVVAILISIAATGVAISMANTESIKDLKGDFSKRQDEIIKAQEAAVQALREDIKQAVEKIEAANTKFISQQVLVNRLEEEVTIRI